LSDDALNDDTNIKGPESGFGLLGMRERIQQWGGTLKLTNDEGAKVVASIPRSRAERVMAQEDRLPLSSVVRPSSSLSTGAQ
jgi:signal transduction histidine kinase